MTAQNDIRVWLVEDQESYRRSAAEAIDDTDGMTCPDTFSNCEEALQRMADTVLPMSFCLMSVCRA